MVASARPHRDARMSSGSEAATLIIAEVRAGMRNRELACRAGRRVARRC